MEQPDIPKKISTDFSYMENLYEKEQIAEWRDSLAHATLVALQMKHGDTNIMIQTHKVLNSRLDACKVKEKSLDQIIKGWQEITEEDMFISPGTEFIFTKISQDVESTFVNRDPLTQMHKKSTVASLFNHGVMHSLYHNTFSKEDILINRSETKIIEKL
jgi:hypothetical protein